MKYARSWICSKVGSFGYLFDRFPVPVLAALRGARAFFSFGIGAVSSDSVKFSGNEAFLTARFSFLPFFSPSIFLTF